MVQDDLEKQEFIADQLEIKKPYGAHIIDVRRDDNNNDLFFVTFYLPKFNAIYKERGKGLRVNLGGKSAEKRLAFQFLYNIGFPGKEIEPKRISNVAGIPAREFEIEKMENWLGLSCNIIFKLEKGFNDPEKVYKNIKREFDIKSDGIQPWFEGNKLSLEDVKALQDKHIKKEPQYSGNGGNAEESDLPF